MSYIWRQSTSSLLRNTRLLPIGSGISLRVASERPKAASVTCAHWIRSCPPGHQGALLETLALHSDVSSNATLTQARGVLAWQPWLQPQLDNLLRLMLQRGMNGTTSTCCPAASSCEGSTRQAAALGMGGTGQARCNASRPGRWSPSLETGEADHSTHGPAREVAATSSGEFPTPSRHVTSYKAPFCAHARNRGERRGGGSTPDSGSPGVVWGIQPPQCHLPPEPKGGSMPSHTGDPRPGVSAGPATDWQTTCPGQVGTAATATHCVRPPATGPPAFGYHGSTGRTCT